jgi:hypothetical protein
VSDVFLPEDQFWVILVGSIVPLATYFQNLWWHDAPEWVKALFQAVVAGVAGGLYTVFLTDTKGFDNVAQQIVSAIIASFFAHNILWKPANVNVKIGARPSPSQTPANPAGLAEAIA